ncbi:phage tail protein [Halalkalicoccus salilacus]|uniref:phage tail protein n=1 Tax=Halalkalicoccus salilacus TaxID=3117459 RepID=UPI00300E99F6
MATRTDPYLSYRFLVEVDSLVVAGFSEVSGLEVETTTEDYQEGGVNAYTHKLFKHVSYPNLVLRKGMSDSQTLWRWIRDATAMQPIAERKNIRVVLLNSTGQESRGWEFREAYPVKWTGPEFQADQASVAIETVELVHRGFSQIEGLS